jgi:hypothetical protein
MRILCIEHVVGGRLLSEIVNLKKVTLCASLNPGIPGSSIHPSNFISYILWTEGVMPQLLVYILKYN